MESIVNKIQKLLALGERGGTEAEAEAAMQKVHELLAKHNLSMDDVKGEEGKEEDYIQDESEGKPRQPWQMHIWNAIAKLYFCRHLTKTGSFGTRHLVIGKASNVAVVKFVAGYVVRTGEELARKAAASSGSPQTFRNSFKKGFAYRVHARVEEEIKKAKSGSMTDSDTGSALILSPLYDKSKSEIDRFIMEQGMKVKRAGGGTMGVSNRDGFVAGRDAANGVSLNANAVGNKTALRIGCK